MRSTKLTIPIILLLILVFTAGCDNKNSTVAHIIDETSENVEINKVEINKKENNSPKEAIQPPKIERLNGTYLVMIENSLPARPQAGLEKADVVYEMLTEGGITRFMAVYSTYDIEKIGPIRSTRVDFVRLVQAYGSPYIHAGGHQAALNLIPKLGVQSLNQIEGRMTPYFWRSKNRKAPHNLYTSGRLIKEGIDTYGYNLGKLGSYRLGEMHGGVAATEINLRYYETVTYKYTDGLYKRYINGEEHILENGEIIAPANIIVLTAVHRPYAPGEERLKIDIIGKGKAFFFISGKVFEGKWERPSAEDTFTFTTVEGREVYFKPGQIWINVIPDENGRMEYK